MRAGVGGLFTRLFGTGSEPEYAAASTSRRVRNWNPRASGPNNVLLGGMSLIRARSRDLTVKEPLVAGAYDKLAANFVGPGMRPVWKGLDSEKRREIMALWRKWCRKADADGIRDFDALISLAVHEWLESGEIFLRRRPRRLSDGLPVPMQIQLIPAEQLPLEKTELSANRRAILGGIELDALGRRAAYHFWKEHPNDIHKRGIRANETVAVPAANVIHFYRARRVGQLRGLPIVTSALLKLHDLSKYSEAELTRALTASMFAAFVTRPAPDDAAFNEDPYDDEAEEGVAVAALEPGTIQYLDMGEEVAFSNPPANGQNFESFSKSVCRQIAAAFGLTYEQFTGDLSGVNFSSIRAGLNEFQRVARMIQKDIVARVHETVFEWWLDDAVRFGLIDLPGIAEDRDLYTPTWVAPGWRYVDPSKEVKADLDAIEGGLTSRAAVAAAHGQDVEEIDEQNAEDKARAEALGLTYGKSKSAPPSTGDDAGEEDTDDGDEKAADDEE